MSIIIQFPSPNTLLSSEVVQTSPRPRPIFKKRRTALPKVLKQHRVDGPTANKPKQSKSRNGCLTCKKKRLKCDETKPSCLQCHKRSVSCEGYKKIFQWKAFEETALNAKSAPRKPKRDSGLSVGKDRPKSSDNENAKPFVKDIDYDEAASPECIEIDADDVFRADDLIGPPPIDTVPELHLDTEVSRRMTPNTEVRLHEPDSVTSSLHSLFTEVGTSICSSARSTPSFKHAVWPDTQALSPAARFHSSPSMTPDTSDESRSLPMGEMDDVDSIAPEPVVSGVEAWISYLGPTSMPSQSDLFLSLDPNLLYRQCKLSQTDEQCVGLLFDRYCTHTCGILSIKDGQNENPWRTTILPMTNECPALYHAVAAMTAFHISKEDSSYRNLGADHVGKASWYLRHRLQDMNTEMALATIISLAFSETWDQHISTGGMHLKAARYLIRKTAVEQDATSMSNLQRAQRKFLLNTWVYMDVISRLTSFEDDDKSTDFDYALTPSIPVGDHSAEIDPLMGCASSLFPWIGRAANLCHEVLRCANNTPNIVHRARKIKEEIERWCPGTVSDYEPPEDQDSETHDAIQTAEAYRYAALLYLHQMVPEIPSLTSAQLAKKALVHLSTVSQTSRLIIVHIFPLLAAGCEALGDDRTVVSERWQAMSDRMWIGNVDKCYEVTSEVWRRRDVEAAHHAGVETLPTQINPPLSQDCGFDHKFPTLELGSYEDMLRSDALFTGPPPAAQMTRSGVSYRSPPTTMPSTPVATARRMHHAKKEKPVWEDLDLELTVRGQMHWVGVMRGWKWEGKLSTSTIHTLV